jgi:hypothetical protein
MTMGKKREFAGIALDQSRYDGGRGGVGYEMRGHRVGGCDGWWR